MHYLFFVVLFFVSSCSKKEPVKIEDNESYFYAKDVVVRIVKITKDTSIYELSKIYDVDPGEIAKLNMISKETVLKPGYIAKVPINRGNTNDNGVLDTDFDIQGGETIKEFSISEYQKNDEFIKKEDKYTNDEQLKFFKVKHPLNNNAFVWPVFGKIISRYGV